MKNTKRGNKNKTSTAIIQKVWARNIKGQVRQKLVTIPLRSDIEVGDYVSIIKQAVTQ